MNARSRNRILWTMSCLVVVYAIVNVIVYFVSGSFGTTWFVLSLAVYGLVLVGALVLLARDDPQSAMPTVAVQVVNTGGLGHAGTSEALVDMPQGAVVERGSSGDPTRHR